MATTGTEKYSRIALTLVKGGTKLTRKFLEKRIKDLNPPDKEFTIDEFLRKHEDTIMQSKTGKNKRSVYFPMSGSTDLGQWDLHMFCFILLETCDLTQTSRMYVEKLQKIRNKLCHLNEPTLADGKYADYSDKLENCFKNCLAEINDQAFTTEIDELVNSFKSGPLALDDTVKHIHTFFHMGFEDRKILEKVNEVFSEMNGKLDKTLDELERIRMQLCVPVNVQDMGIVIEVKNCSNDKETEVLDVLVKHFNEIVNKNESHFEEVLPNGALHAIREVVKQTFLEFLQMGRHIVKVEHKCIMLTIKCGSVTSFVNLIRDYRNDALNTQLQGLQSALRSDFDCSELELETIIYRDDFWNVIDSLVATFREVQPKHFQLKKVISVSKSDNLSTSANSSFAGKNRLSNVRVAKTPLQDATAYKMNSNRLTVYQIPSLEGCIRAKDRQQLNVKPKLKEVDSANGRSKEDDNKHADTYGVNVSSDNRVPVFIRKDKHSGKMAAEFISEFMQKGHDALRHGNEERAKHYTLQALACINNEKEKFFTGLADTITEQQLADWYGGCSFILNKIGEFFTASRCFYTATIFDQKWNFKSHTAVSENLLGGLVYSRDLLTLSLNIQKIRTFLVELDNLAKLAERRKKWSVCVALDGDINKMYNFLRHIGLIRQDLITLPGRKSEMWRAARCYLALNLHQEVQKVCSAILQHVCDYDDSEALAIWARSLYLTGDFDLAFKKNELALNYCQGGCERKRLEAFKAEIEVELAKTSVHQSDQEWLAKTKSNNLNAADGRYQAKFGGTLDKAAIYRIGRYTPSLGAHSSEKAGRQRSPFPAHSREKDNGKTTAKTVSSVVKRLILDDNGKRRSTDSSKCSTGTIETSGYGTESLNDLRFSKSNSDKNASFDYVASSRTTYIDLISDRDVGFKSLQEKMSFYEQRGWFPRSKEVSKHFGRANTDENLLRTGITLNMSYLHQFMDRHPDHLKREFYTDFLGKDELQELLLKNPNKYIKCVIQIESSREACCTPANAHDSIDIIEISGRSKIGQAFNEDEVVVEILDDRSTKDKRYGKVIGVWQRQRHRDTKHPVFICTFIDKESHFVRPICNTVPKIHILNRKIKQEWQNEIERRYKVEIYEYDERAGILCNPIIVDVNQAEPNSVIFLVAFIKWGLRDVYPRGAIIKRLPSGQ